jgi:lysophospholipase L1-like esterase
MFQLADNHQCLGRGSLITLLLLFPCMVWPGSVSATSVVSEDTNILADASNGANDNPADLRWIVPGERGLEMDGLPWFKENGGSLSRLPQRDKAEFRKQVWSLAQCPSGARIRFRTDSSNLAIRLEYGSPPNMLNMQAYGQTGVDVYVDGEYLASAVADKDARAGKVYERMLFAFPQNARMEREIVLYLPLYKPVKILGVGVEPNAKIANPKPFARARPVVFYGTSITQGGCASRPGMSYEAILCRQLNIDFVNLGFSGNGLGEPEVARAVAEIDAACFVLDFGANHKTFDAMREVYAPFLEHIRARHPKTPIVVVTLLHTSREKRIPSLGADWRQRRQFIEGIVREQIKAGDNRLYLVDGGLLLGRAPDDCLVDGSHPNDLGFSRMAEGLRPVIGKALNLK